MDTTNPSSPSAVAASAPVIIRRENYTPPSWLVPEIRLDFRLDLAETLVTARMHVQRNPAGDQASELRLQGDGLSPLRVLVDGGVAKWQMDGNDLVVILPSDRHEITIKTIVQPQENSQLMGLYASGGMLCTQCEAEGFRRITFALDRPDVLSVYTVRMEGSQSAFPVLLSNGNCVAQGKGLAGGADADDRHWAEWHDPWPKPSYLFALVAGELVAHSDRFTTMSGREVALNIWVRAGDENRTQHAMDSLIASMKWDEEVFGLEYDLDLFNIVAVSDFNMGAMENKGLNIFNTRYVLADPETANDMDYDGIESVIGHEYFHNWSGNRITCRDWFQLSLKEGFTVLRDQLFSADLGSEPVKRIEDVRILRGGQYPEDSGPLAHPIRPDSYQEISNFYTATIYNKGAEVIRMMRTMAGVERFRKGTDLYFERHDGEAATCEDFVKAIEDGAGLDLTQFRLWYSQAGTPKVRVAMVHEGSQVRLRLEQTVPPTPGQPNKQAMPIPLKLALFDRAAGRHTGEQLIVLDQDNAEFVFDGFAERPVLSLNRGFSAPVQIESDAGLDDLIFLAAKEDDAFARYEAMQELVLRYLVATATDTLTQQERVQQREAIRAALQAILEDSQLDDLMRGELMLLPSEAYVAENIQRADPAAIHTAREDLKAWLAQTLSGTLIALHDRVSKVPYSRSAEARGARKVKTQALVYLAAGVPDEAVKRAAAQYKSADNMTDRQGALMVLCGLDTPERAAGLADFYTRFQGNALVIDKWFALQAGSLHKDVASHVRDLAQHPDFSLQNPNRVRALYMSAAMNPSVFHAEDGAGYRLIADLILGLDPINAQTAARFVPPLGRWKRIEEGRSARMQAELERIQSTPKLSRDTLEQVVRSLA